LQPLEQFLFHKGVKEKMNTFKRKALSCAILGGLGAVAGTAHAVYEDPNGLGQALIFPYYTVQSVGSNQFNTYVSVVNTISRAKALKVRFREGKNSREVLDFNLYLSPNDVWTASITPTSATGGGHLATQDKSCTAPTIGTGGVDFRNYAYNGAAADGAGTGLDRTREGYLEVVEMATLTGSIATAVTHVNGTPANCNAVQPANFSAGSAPAGTFTPPNGGVTGSYQIINVNSGASFGGNPTVLANFSAASIYTDVGDETTNLSSANPPVAVVVVNQQTGVSGPGATVYSATYANGADAVSATLMHSNVINEYSLDIGAKATTDWVMTFPTKRFYVTTANATPPFTNKFVATGACEPISFSYFNREEAGQVASAGDFSPLPAVQTQAICWESQVLSIVNSASSSATSAVLGSANSLQVSVNPAFENGWANLSFTGTGATTGLSSTGSATITNVNTGAASPAASTATFRGLPVIGFMVRTLNNSLLTCGTATCTGAFGALYDHKYQVSVTPAP